MAFPLPAKPSIAVLPFANLSDDPEQDYFADGVAEDLIADLSKNSDLFVIARNSSFSYKGQAVKVRQVAEELGVRYLLEGSVRRAGDTVRVTAQLIDATTGGHLWAERYDQPIVDLFALQDGSRGGSSRPWHRVSRPPNRPRRRGRRPKTPKPTTPSCRAGPTTSASRPTISPRPSPISRRPSSSIPATAGPMPPWPRFIGRAGARGTTGPR